jgi:hypothetical protein
MKGSAEESSAFARVKNELMRWEGVTLQAHRFGGIEFRVNGREIGHMHGDSWADLPFPMPIRNELVNSGKASPHHILPNSGWITYRIRGEEDVQKLIGLFRMQYDRLSKRKALSNSL